MMFTKKTKLFAGLMAAVMLISLFAAFAMPASALTNGEAEALPRASAFADHADQTAFQVADARDLNYVAKNPNSFGADVTLYITADIKVNGQAANHLGCHASIDGLGHTLTGVTVTAAATAAEGWLAQDYAGKFIRNITFDGWIATSLGTGSGMLIGRFASGDFTMENVKVQNFKAIGGSATRYGMLIGHFAPLTDGAKATFRNVTIENCSMTLSGSANDGIGFLGGYFSKDGVDGTHTLMIDGLYLNNNTLDGTAADPQYHQGIGIVLGRTSTTASTTDVTFRNVAVTNTTIGSEVPRVSTLIGAFAGGNTKIDLNNVYSFNNGSAVGLVFGRSDNTLKSYTNVFSGEDWLISGTGGTELSGTANNNKNRIAEYTTPEYIYNMNANNVGTADYIPWAMAYDEYGKLGLVGAIDAAQAPLKITLEEVHKDPEATNETYVRYTDKNGKLIDIEALEGISWTCGGLANASFTEETVVKGYVGYFGITAKGSAYEVNNGATVDVAIGLENCSTDPESIDYLGYYDPAVLSTSTSKIKITYPKDKSEVYIKDVTEGAFAGWKQIGIALANEEGIGAESAEVPVATITFTVSNTIARGTVTYVRSFLENATKTNPENDTLLEDMLPGTDYSDAPKDVNIMVSYNHQWTPWTPDAGNVGPDATMSRTCLDTTCGVTETVPCVFDKLEEVDASCVSDEYDRYTCTTCGYYYDIFTPGTLLGHDFESSEEMGHIEGTEGADSRHAIKCIRCDEVDLETGEDCEFESKYINASCTKAGYTRYACAKCDYYYDVTDPSAPRLGHSWGKWTAKGDGNHSRVCKRDSSHTQSQSCNYVLQSSSTKPTCVTPGKNNYKCSDCGDTRTETVKAPYKEHQQVVIRYCAPDFDAKGRNGFIDDHCVACNTRIDGPTVLKAGQPFPDVKNDKGWYYDYAVFCKSFNIIQGNGMGEFMPNGTVSRSQVAVIIGEMFKSQYEDINETTVGTINTMSDAQFNAFLKKIEKYSITDKPVTLKDVKGTWYERYAKLAAKLGIVAGNEKGEFMGNNNVTREQLAVMFKNFITANNKLTGNTKDYSFDDNAPYTYKDYRTVSSWAKPYVEWASETGLFAGDGEGNFRPQDTAVRSELAVLAQKVYVEIRGIWIVDHNGTKLN